MIKKIALPIKLFLSLLPLLIIQKPLFMLFNRSETPQMGFRDFIDVIWHGLPLDLTVAGYITALPLLMMLVSIFWHTKLFNAILKYYLIIICALLAVIFSVDLELYGFWGFRLDATPFFYLTNPKLAMASTNIWVIMRQVLIGVLYGWVAYKWLKRFVITKNASFTSRCNPITTTPVALLLGGLVFIAIRGGVTVSTANVGMVYYSPNLFFNHAAINPAFSLLSSISKQKAFDKMYDYLEEGTRETLFAEMLEKHDGSFSPDSAHTLLRDKRPDIYLIILESFSANAVEALGGTPGITPNLDKLSKEGILFENFYTNTFRTDRGLVSVINGYPAQPSTSIMKYPAKSQSLPSLARSLNQNGYRSEFIYGGDINFTNMQSHFRAGGYERIISDANFPLSDKLSKWGANDDVTFKWLYNDVMQDTSSMPVFRTFLTLSSHEPFEVPYHKFENPYLNTVAFADSCIGVFTDELKASGKWDNSLLIFVSDHGFKYPDTLDNYTPARYHIPMIWAGGAIEQPKTIERYGSQIDLAATLLGQLGIDYSEFEFSKNMMNPDAPQFAYYSFSNGFGILDSTQNVVFDADSKTIQLAQDAETTPQYADKVKAFVQSLYDDLGKR